jgi:hypothetical protein
MLNPPLLMSRAFFQFAKQSGYLGTCPEAACRLGSGDFLRRGGRVAEGARLESVYTGNRIAGSNPAPSAIFSVTYCFYCHF